MCLVMLSNADVYSSIKCSKPQLSKETYVVAVRILYCGSASNTEANPKVWEHALSVHTKYLIAGLIAMKNDMRCSIVHRER